MRDCQPAPVARRVLTTSADKRIVIRSLVGATCGPRTPSFLRSDVGSASAAGLNFSRSATRSSRTSAERSISFLELGMTSCLTVVGLPQTDDTDPVFSLGEAHHMQTTFDGTQGNIPGLTVVLPLHAQRRPVERPPARRNVRGSGSPGLAPAPRAPAARRGGSGAPLLPWSGCGQPRATAAGSRADRPGSGSSE